MDNTVLVSAIHQHESAIGIHMSPRSSASPTPHPIPSFQVVTEHQFELLESYSKFPLAIYFTYGSVYVSRLLSPFVHLLATPPCP